MSSGREAELSQAAIVLFAGADPTELVNVLASIGSEGARSALQAAARSDRGDVAAAARQALSTLNQIRGDSG